MDETDKAFFESFRFLAPVVRLALWKGRQVSFTYHILINSEELDLRKRVVSFPEEEQLLREGELRCAYSLDAVDGKEVRIGLEEGPLRDPSGHLYEAELIARANYIHGWRGPLMDAVLISYALAAQEPVTMLAEMISDPNIAAERSSNGEPSNVSAPLVEGL